MVENQYGVTVYKTKRIKVQLELNNPHTTVQSIIVFKSSLMGKNFDPLTPVHLVQRGGKWFLMAERNMLEDES